MNANSLYKKFFINAGIFIALVGLSFFILFYSVKLSRKSWQKNLKLSVEKVLDEKEANTWTVGNFIPINNPFLLTSACYEVQNRNSGEILKTVILRVQTLYGPLAAVFLIDEKDVEFVGYSSLHGRIAQQIYNKPSDKRINFWEQKVLEIIE